MMANGKITQRYLALAENEGCNRDAEHGKIRLVSIMLFVLCWWIQWRHPGQDWCVKKSVLLMRRMLWQSELAAQSLEVSFSCEFNFVSCSALRLRERKDTFRATVSSWGTGLSVTELEQAMRLSCFTVKETFGVLKCLDACLCSEQKKSWSQIFRGCSLTF